MEPPRPSKPRGSKPPSPAARALRLLARREHTRRELATKLGPHLEDPQALQTLLDEFTARGWLCESRVVEQVLHAKRGRFGAARIRQTLIERGVPDGLIASALDSLKATELETARSVWSRKFRSAGSTPAERARQVRFLQSRGFSLEVAMQVVRGRNGNRAGEPE